MLPDVVTGAGDIDLVCMQEARPNFITQETVTGETASPEEMGTMELGGKIVLLEKADPGFDWIFAQEIGGSSPVTAGRLPIWPSAAPSSASPPPSAAARRYRPCAEDVQSDPGRQKRQDPGGGAMRLLISQRETVDAYGAAADTLEAAYIRFFAELGMDGWPVPNFLPDPEKALAEERFDGLVLTGGGSLPPVYYRQPHTDRLQPNRDRTEKALIGLCREQGRPILGICRGMQYLNALWGGKLSRLEGLRVPRPIRVDHPVEVMGEQWLVNQYHNDGIYLEDLAPGLTPLAVDRENGVVEAFTAPGILALQWHPERPFADSGTREKTAALIRRFFATGDGIR